MKTRWAPPASWGVHSERSESLRVDVVGVALFGRLIVPAHSWGMVVLPQGAPHANDSPRTAYLARLIRDAGLATLVCELVGDEPPDVIAELAADAASLQVRLEAWFDALRRHPAVAALPVAAVAPGVAFAAAVRLAAARPGLVRALVALAGRTDLVAGELPCVRVPTLLIAGEHDLGAVRQDRQALRQLRCTRRLELISGAHRHFSGPGAVGRVGVRVRRWLRRYLPVAVSPEHGSPVLRLMVDRSLEASPRSPEPIVPSPHTDTFRNTVPSPEPDGGHPRCSR